MSIADKLKTIADNEQKVYDAGKDEEWNTFWDNFQDNGNRGRYYWAFAEGFNVYNFKPKYDIILNDSDGSGSYIFAFFNGRNTSNLPPIDMVELFNTQGITLDTSSAKQMNYAFGQANISRLGTIDLSNAISTAYLFYGSARLCRIEKLIISENTVCASNWFAETGHSIKYIGVEGTIANSVSFYNPDLTPDNMKQIIGCLKNYAGTEHEFEYNIKFNETNWAALEADSVSPAGTTWAEYVDSLGWGI